MKEILQQKLGPWKTSVGSISAERDRPRFPRARQAIGAVEALLDEARRELANKLFRERRTTWRESADSRERLRFASERSVLMLHVGRPSSSSVGGRGWAASCVSVERLALPRTRFILSQGS